MWFCSDNLRNSGVVPGWRCLDDETGLNWLHSL